MKYIFIILLLNLSLSVCAECESWEPNFRFKLEDASFRETMTWLSGWSFALEAMIADNPQLKMCIPKCGFASKEMSEILNREYAGDTISAEIAAAAIYPEITKFYQCN